MTFIKNGPKLIEVRNNEGHLGWLEQHTRTQQLGINLRRITYWSGIIVGRNITAQTLTKAKLLARAAK